MSQKTELYCPVQFDLKNLAGKQCPCGWPEQPCIKMHPQLRTDQPPEPGCYDDGETWRAK